MSDYAFDSLQQQAIEATDGHYLVLAPPGCGKTHILAERITNALLGGLQPSDLLCLTFTNRASRGMRDRVEERLRPEIESGRIQPGATREIFVGNIHRYCSFYLFENSLVPENTYIIDEDDQADIFFDFNPSLFRSRTGVNRGAVKYVVDLASYITQYHLGHPEELRPQSPGLLDQTTNAFIQRDFEHFLRIAKKYNFDISAIPTQHSALIAALTYLEYKKKIGAIDFSDLLILAYDHMRSNPDLRKFPWIQVDEVQDLNRLQIAIVDLLTAPENPTVMYLGDEQQAIFSFMGAKLSCLELIKNKCAGHILTLQSNYRAPSYLLDVYNDFAAEVLGVDRQLLPVAKEQTKKDRFDLIIARSQTPREQRERISKMVSYYMGLSDDERLAILVNRNDEADDISKELTEQGVSNFKISGSDMFRSRAYKTISAFLTVVVNDFNIGAWTRLLYGIGAVHTQLQAREFCYKLRSLMLTGSDLMGHQSFLQRFASECLDKEYVLFDTETTGLNVAEDDIVQIAAFKVRDGRKVDGSDFNIIMHTDREIPAMLGDKPNPLVAEYASRPHMGRAEGLEAFLKYVGTLPVVGHNVEYDYRILQANCRRELNEEVELDYYDTLHMVKCVYPSMKRYTLEALISHLGLQGENAHLADADIEATLSLIDHCAAVFRPKLSEQSVFLADAHTKAVAKRLQDIAPIYANLRSYIHEPICLRQRTICDELASLHRTLVERHIIEDIGPKFDIFLRFVEREWVDRATDKSLHESITEHVNDISTTVNEGDLVSSRELLTDRVFILTVHKAKGLEFENVVVLGVSNGNYPFWKVNDVRCNYNATPEMIAAADAMEHEDARKLYVALTRARKRLCISYAVENEFGYKRGPSPFLKSIAHHFAK